MKRSSQTAFPDEDPEFQVAPMIDILLVLMTFFMSITSTEVLKSRSKLDLNLPVAKDSGPQKTSTEVVLNITYNPTTQKQAIECEQKFLQGPADVTNEILQRRGNNMATAFRAVIRADEKVPYWAVQEILGACASANVDNITFYVLSKEKAGYKGDQHPPAAP
jgi:biopolymer transport protein ExbD